MNRREFLRAGGTGLTGAALASAYSATIGKRANARERRPNILWFMLDDGRADALGCYGSSWARTPNLDRLASEGVLFSAAFVQNPVCIPSRRSMKTGFYSHQAGPVAMGRPPAESGAYIDRDLMKRLGSAPTLLDAWTGVGMKPVNVGKLHGFRRCWQHRGDEPKLISVSGRPTGYFRKRFGRGQEILRSKMVFTKTHHWQIGGVLPIKPKDTVTWRIGDKALGVLEELAGKKEPFFLRVSFHAPHVACYVPKEYFIDPAKIDLPLPTEDELKSKPRFEQGPLHVYGHADHLGREGIDLARGTYYGMVSLVDVQVGRIVDALKASGRLDDTVIAFNSDQGFQLGEHGLWKKRVFYDQNVKVPFFLRYPPVLPRGKRIDELVEMVDFLPTLMDLSGLPVPDGIRGRSVVPLARGKVRKWREAVFSEIDHSQSMYKELRRDTGRRVMVRTKGWKLVFFMDDRVKDKDGALYDLRNDPWEQRNLYGDPRYNDRVKELEALAGRWDRGENLMA
jgi:arylsulfatase A-like enzyme